MALTEQQLLSKVLDEQNFYVLNRYNVTADDFTTERPVYEFIKSYTKEYRTTPDFRTVVAEFPDFEYYPEVHDKFPYLCKVIKGATAKRLIFNTLQKEAVENFPKMKGNEFVRWLQSEVDKVSRIADPEVGIGTNYATNGAERLQWYEDSKRKGSDVFIPTPYPTLTEWLSGGMELGDYVLFMAYTNRGKSWIASHFGMSAWEAGFGVLHYSPELTKQQTMGRLDTLKGHFSNTGLRNGELQNEKAYYNYLQSFNDEQETPYIVKTMEDLQGGLTIDTIETDLNMMAGVKLVIIDGFNLMDHKGRGSNRDNMSNTSRRLRQLFGKYGVVGMVIHQTPTSAEKENKTTDEIGTRILTPPELTQYSETAAVIQDACTVLTFDANDGLGAIKIAKARVPNVGKTVELQVNFNYGLIDEMTQSFEF